MRPTACLALVTVLGCSRAEPPRPAPATEASAAPAPELAVPESIDKGDGLKVEILVRGTGAEVASTSEVALHYEAFVAGREEPFDSTRAGGAPLRVRLDLTSGPRVIAGLARGLVGLREGAHARISIPPALAWGAGGNDAAGVPADAELVYDVRVVGVE